MQQHRDSTSRNYYVIWKIFNKFILKLDRKPSTWEDRIILFVGHLVQSRKQSATIKSYVSAIKAVLKSGNIKIDDNISLLSSLTKAIRLINDKVQLRLPIQLELLLVLLKHMEQMFNQQPYLKCMYKALFLTTYYGLFRIGEVTSGSHPIKACDVRIAHNKEKIMFVLRSSKTHDKKKWPQQIKITSTSMSKQSKLQRDLALNSNLGCPYLALQNYIKLHKSYRSAEEPFFVFRDRTPVKPEHMRQVLTKVLVAVGYTRTQHLYCVHGMRAEE